jgi:hypothetical protein
VRVLTDGGGASVVRDECAHLFAAAKQRMAYSGDGVTVVVIDLV